MIQTLNKMHVASVAELHCRALTGLVKDLGLNAATVYYESAEETGLAIGRVYIHGGKVVGFVFGAKDPVRLRRAVMRRHPMTLISVLLGGFIRRPRVFVYFLASMLGGQKFESDTAELIYLAVAPDERKSGIGKELVAEFDQCMQSAGISAYELSVDASNEKAIGFYQKLGFRSIGSYSEFGTDHIRMKKNLG